MKPSEILRRAMALIDTPDKWIKFHFQKDGRFCADGAIVRFIRWPGIDAAREFLKNGIGDKFGSMTDRITRFNDAPTTTHADVMAAFQRAIAAAEEAGQ
ncbi:MAG: hypothetical protein KGL39_44940 [Patescibacteria group bacterium]|nr:hypothetical protein [Patescibacteria group bacterium]